MKTTTVDKGSSVPLWTKDFVMSTVVNFLLMLNYFVLMVVMADYTLNTFEASASLAGLASSIFIIGALIARFFAGSLMEVIGRKKMLVFGAVCVLISSCLYFFCTSIGTLLILRLCHGISYGVASTAIGTISASVIPRQRKGEGIGYYTLSITLGAALGPFLGILFIQHGGPQLVFAFCIAVAMTCVLCAAALRVPGLEIAAIHKKETSSARGLGRFIEPGVVPISIVIGIIFFCYSSLIAFLTPFSIERDLQTAASIFFLVYAAAMFVTRPYVCRLLDRKGDRIVMVPAFISFIIGLLILSLCTSSIMLLVAAAFCGFGVGTIQSSGLAIAMKETPDERLGVANSTYYIFLDIGLGIGPFILGLFLASIDYSTLYFALTFVVLFGLVFYLVARRQKGHIRQE